MSTLFLSRIWHQVKALMFGVHYRLGRYPNKGCRRPPGSNRTTAAYGILLQATSLCAVLGPPFAVAPCALADESFFADDLFYTSELNRGFDESLVSHLSATEQALVREYAIAWPHLGLFYDKLKVTGKYRSESRMPGGDEFEVSEHFDGTVQLSGFHHFRIEGRSPDGQQGLIFVTPDEIYVFGSNRETGKHFLAMKMSCDSRYAEMYTTRYRLHKDPYICGELSSLMKGRNPGPEIQAIKIDRVEAVPSGDDEIITITVVCSGPGWCRVIANEFIRNRAWARRAGEHVLVELEKKRYTIHRVRCDYQGTQDGFPLLRETVNETSTADFSDDSDIDRCRFVKYGQDFVTHREVMTFDKIEHIVPDPHDFDPAPYIAEMGGLGKNVEPNGATRLVRLLALNIIVLGVMAFVLWRRRSTRTSLDDRRQE